jgi:hypothetical protein
VVEFTILLNDNRLEFEPYQHEGELQLFLPPTARIGLKELQSVPSCVGAKSRIDRATALNQLLSPALLLRLTKQGMITKDMMTKLKIPQDQIADFCRRCQITEMGILRLRLRITGG